ncbi:MAG: hypothetical protein II975_08205 [Bacteroidales bacterium]|nr:hypothetical protein [Bacteroidales bacterium]MBQ6742087.1 hypothetical protein [Bacteroidales bacterium]
MPRKNKYSHQDWIALRIAARYDLVEEYKTARRHRRTPLQALEEWDLLTEENLKLLLNPTR